MDESKRRAKELVELAIHALASLDQRLTLLERLHCSPSRGSIDGFDYPQGKKRELRIKED